MQIEGRTAVITGGASGLGAAAARRLAAAGARIAILDQNAVEGRKLGQELGGLHFETDITRDSDVEAAVAGIVAKLGPPQILVNAAGLAAPYRRTVGRRGAYPMDVFRKIVDVNLNGTFLCSTLVGTAMAENEPLARGERGVIINVASITAYDGPIGTVAYTAAKAGVLGMTITMARDLAHLGIRVCTVAPGSFDTPMMRNQSDAPALDELRESVPFPNDTLGNPDDFSFLVQHICENVMLNGETIRLDGAARLAQC